MTDEGYQTATVQGKEIPYDPETLRRIRDHPCFSEKACHKSGRAHLAVAPKCNIQCNYCVRDFDCVNESRPGVASEVLSPEQGLARVREILDKFPYVKVIGIAGPGEPLANPETLETMRLIHENHPHLILCISTNGLLLPDVIDELIRYDAYNLTVTLNAVDPEIGAQIYSHVTYKGKKYVGVEGAKLLLEQQLKGIQMAVERKMIVKINTVYIPGINDEHIPEIAKVVGAMGVFNFNIIPLIPQYKFADITPPTPAMKRAMHDRCAPYVKQMKHCQRCRADAVGKLGQDVQSSLSSPCAGEKEE
ncbi:nitrogenase molybdenum-iron cofactor biosynthesis protein [Methanocalculus chunghsingensis]|uniref:FeMo cofactor biosynthesis protein NifB n=1 Tax=Methanocalculus chunghsingensis TaxID=156457 RepID=A0A8J8B5M2_9EURY|nr:nitrogenase cofactor biosynthesis protein NifB [Methanocalculus chunghsingensis]MBR1369223.1 nitrogenase molybdenum-iron cofactor biosynthesis protein [Methanocalculus chunghsingensis]